MKALTLYAVLAVALLASAGTLADAGCMDCPPEAPKPCMDCPPAPCLDCPPTLQHHN